MTPNQLSAFSATDMAAFRPALKIGILATVSEAGLPHLTLITTLMAAGPRQVVWGQFMEGSSKAHIRANPHAAFLIMTLQKEMWRGQATFTHTARQGPEYDFYNNTPMFRYNAYFGVHTAYYMDLIGHTGRTPLPMGKIVPAALLTMLARATLRSNDFRSDSVIVKGEERTTKVVTTKEGTEAATVINGWSRGLLNGLSNLKFLAYVGAEGYPWIVPVIQAQAADAEHVLLSTAAYGEELRGIAAGAPVALLGLALSMEDVLLRGVWQGVRRVGGVACGSLRADWAYNPMPPVPQRIYPPVEMETVEAF